MYHHEIPEFLYEFMQTKEMKRIKNVGMNCGVDYTSFPLFKNIQYYSRYDHSVGVALIIWHFTKDIKQTIAGLFHDISTPVFAHTIDFMNGDYQQQESTEEGTQKIIEESLEIQKLLKKYHLKTEDVCDYHLYPIADNDTPQLSADRLEYTLGNIYNFHFGKLIDIKRFYDDLMIGQDENGKPELSFQTQEMAIHFFRLMMKTSHIYVCDEDRISMQILAKLVRYAIEYQVISYEDLYTTETNVIDKLEKHVLTRTQWQNYCLNSSVKISKIKVNENCLKIDAKKRYINPLVKNQRLSSLSYQIQQEMMEFQNRSFNYWVYLD